MTKAIMTGQTGGLNIDAFVETMTDRVYATLKPGQLVSEILQTT